jgi:hypothetical protein
MIADTTSAYWACFLDMGRGTFAPWNKKGGMKVRIEAQDRRLLKQLQSAFGGSLSRSRGPYERQWGARVLYALTISGHPARQMIAKVLPHMRRRRAVAEVWLKSYPAGCQQKLLSAT